MRKGGEKLTAEEAKARRNRVVRMAIAVAVLIPSVAMVIVNHMATPVPPPLWTADSLPVPADTANGWPVIAHYDFMTISGVNLDPIDKLLEASKSGTPLPELGRLLGPARAVAATVRKHTATCSDAFERERMVVPCLALERGACSAEPLEICARLTMFAALDDASRGSARATSRMSNVLRQLTDASANSPHPWIQARALLLLRQAIHQAGSIIKWRRVDVRALREALEQLSETSLPLLHAVIGTYLLKHMALRQALDRADTWLLDEGTIMREFNAPFERAARGEPLPPPRDHTQGLFWWFRNPIGKKMLDALQPGADGDFVKLAELRASVLKRRDEALALK